MSSGSGGGNAATPSDGNRGISKGGTGGGSQFGSRVSEGRARPVAAPIVGQGPVAAVANSWVKQLTADPRAVLFGGIAIVMLAGSMVYEYK